ncbi:hypothetical protein JOB18_036649 [Scomber scombrus]|uniref:H15 domain-containing protein n=1 Tax=Scomber scombrus TaxID=13677 RepID=A0AAV1PMZ6_SCOSC
MDHDLSSEQLKGNEYVTIKAKIHSHHFITITSVYCPPGIKPSADLFTAASNTSCSLIMGDFNAKHINFYCNKTNSSGTALQQILNNNNLSVINTNEPTYISPATERIGVSLAALKKALAAEGYDVDKNKARVKPAVKSLVTKGTLVQTKGTGAFGYFKMSKKVETKPKKAPVKKAAPKAKKPAAKNPAAAKKPKTAAKKAAVAKKSLEKVKKPAAVKKAAKSPKKAAKSPNKVVKKAPAKKVAKPKAKKAAPKKK